MSYEQEDHYGFEVTPKWQPDEEESDMPDSNVKRFTADVVRLQDLPKPFNPYAGVPVTEEDIVSRDELMDDCWLRTNLYFVEDAEEFRLPEAAAEELRRHMEKAEETRRLNLTQRERGIYSARFVGTLLGALLVIGFIAWWAW